MRYLHYVKYIQSLMAFVLHMVEIYTSRTNNDIIIYSTFAYLSIYRKTHTPIYYQNITSWLRWVKHAVYERPTTYTCSSIAPMHLTFVRSFFQFPRCSNFRYTKSQSARLVTYPYHFYFSSRFNSESKRIAWEKPVNDVSLPRQKENFPCRPILKRY